MKISGDCIIPIKHDNTFLLELPNSLSKNSQMTPLILDIGCSTSRDTIEKIENTVIYTTSILLLTELRE